MKIRKFVEKNYNYQIQALDHGRDETYTRILSNSKGNNSTSTDGCKFHNCNLIHFQAV